jgi:DNA polymerase-3 subunit epsilon/ATP-dependent DNA helicase DinG
VLLGTSSFWEGVDVVGDALSCLVIARLPFAVPTDPVFAARSELFDDPFREYAVPQAILRFRQGFGRLIRSRTDRGVVAILDRRLHTKRYGRAFLDSLPDCTVRVGSANDLPELASRWLER